MTPLPRLPLLQKRLLRWYTAHGRHAHPWRKTRDPYRILLSEYLLQQTTVSTAEPYYHRFLARFPDVQRLAAAPIDKVLSLWSGLGYYARARHLHAASQAITKQHKGRVPQDLDTLLSLPGIGPYTAGAIRAFAFNQPAAVLDGNIIRVLARLTGCRQSINKTTAKKTLDCEALRLSRHPDSRGINLALMDLGNAVCTPLRPLCATCPLRGHCTASQKNLQERIPVKDPPRKPVPVSWVSAVIIDDGRVLLSRQDRKGLFGGLWECPGGDAGKSHPTHFLEQELKKKGFSLRVLKALTPFRHVLSHRTLHVQPFRCRWQGGALRPKTRFLKWVPFKVIQSLATSRLTQIIIQDVSAPLKGEHKP